MTPEEYKKAAIRTENTPLFIDHARRRQADTNTEQWNHAVDHDRRLSRMMHAILGMITELGELCDPVKRHLIYGAPLDVKSNEKGSLREEMGDRAWYDAQFLDAIDIKIEDIWERNIAKLRARFPDKFTEDKAVNRDLEAEGKALETKATPFHHEFHAMEALTRIAHRLGVDAPTKLVSSSNKRIAEICIKCIDEERSDARALRERLEKLQVGLKTLSMG